VRCIDGDTTVEVQVRISIIWPIAAFELMVEEVCETEGLVGDSGLASWPSEDRVQHHALQRLQ
jgi:hypothetical protein